MIARSPPPDSVKDECGFVGHAPLVTSGASLASLFLALCCFATRCFDRIQPDCLTGCGPSTGAQRFRNQNELKFRRVRPTKERQQRLGILPPCEHDAIGEGLRWWTRPCPRRCQRGHAVRSRQRFDNVTVRQTFRDAGGRGICQPPSSSMRTRASASSAVRRFGSSSVHTPVPAASVIAALG
jgi:hypothetical protein